jgi:hypothetical protein
MDRQRVIVLQVHKRILDARRCSAVVRPFTDRVPAGCRRVILFLRGDFMRIKQVMCWSAVLLLVIAAGCKKEESLPAAVVTFVIGDVTRNGQPVDIYDQVSEKDVFVTGKESSCDVKIGESIIRIKENSKLEFSLMNITGNADRLALGLDGGQLLCKPKRLLKDESFTVRTPTAIAGVRGTQFTITTDTVQTTQIKVYDGQVQVAKRVAALDDQAEKVLSVGTVVEQSEAVVVTRADADAAAKKVEAAMAAGAKAEDAAAVIELSEMMWPSQGSRDCIQDRRFKNENRELIAVQKNREVMCVFSR